MIPPSCSLPRQGWGLIDLPLRASNEGLLRPCVARAQKIIRFHPQTSDGFRVLLADDHGLIRQLICAMLEHYPAVSIVGEAADGLEAISMAAVLKPDGIIMDINMPQIDGIEATKHIKAAQPMIRIIRTLRH
jgi:PleD family two-component response regulator